MQITAVAAGDINADGNVDVVAAQSNGDVVIHIGDGKGGFTPGAGTPLGEAATSLHLVDLDGDAKLDILAVTATSGVQLIAATTFAATATAAVSASAITVRDLGSDGAPDLFVAVPGNQVKLYANNNAGAVAFSKVSTEAAGIRSLTTVDSNADGVAEAVVAVDTSTQLAFYDGSGGSFVTAYHQLAGGVSPRAIVAADMDVDGRRDLLLFDGAGPALLLEKGKGSGLGLFGSLTSIALPSALASGEPLRVIDADLDGRPDVAALQSNGDFLIVRLDATANLVLSAAQTGVATATCMTIADVNHDGRPDVVMGSGAGLAFALNKIPSCSDGVADGTETDVDCGGGCQPCTKGMACNTNSDCVTGICVGVCATMGLALNDAVPIATLTAGAGAVVAAPADATGGLDLFVTVPTTGQVAIVQGDGLGGFVAPVLTPSSPQPASLPTTLAIFDARRDGVPDMLIGDPGSLGLLLINGTGSASSWGTPAVLPVGPVYGLGTGDLDGDGITDYFATDAVNTAMLAGLGLENGRFLTLPAKPIGAVPGKVKVADINGDGRLDLISAAVGIAELDITKGRGPGIWKQPLAAPQGISSGAPVAAFALADVDGDGLLDMVLGLSNGSVKLYLQTAGGGFTVPTVDTLSTSIVDVAIADLDGDGDLDLLVLEGAGVDQLRVYPNLGAGLFGGAISKTVVGGAALAVGRFDADRKVDVVVVPAAAGSVVLLTNGGI